MEPDPVAEDAHSRLVGPIVADHGCPLTKPNLPMQRQALAGWEPSRTRVVPALTSDPSRIRTSRLENWESLSGLEAAWTDLLDRSPGSSVFQTFPWHACWWKVFGAPHQLFVILAYTGDRLVGIAPMMIAREKGSLGRAQRQLHFIGSRNGASDYCDFIIDPDVPEALDALLLEICD